MKNSFLCLAFCLSVAVQLMMSGQTVPHHFSGITILEDRTVNLRLEGAVSNRFKGLFDVYVLETSGDLQDWTFMVTLVRTNADTNSLRCVDSSAVGQGRRFYRTPDSNFVTPFWQQTGPYNVGTLERVLSDPSRTNRYGVKTNSSFYAKFWYPARPGAGALPERIVEGDIGAVLGPRLNGFIAGAGTVTILFVQAFKDSPVATNQTAYPVLIYSCGGGAFRQDNSGLALELASHGYVVVSADHEDNSIIRVPGGSIVSGKLAADSIPTYQSRFQDMQVVLDELAKMNLSDPVLGGYFDLERIGVAGWSTGGVDAAQACLKDERIKAGVLLDPGLISSAPDLLKVGIRTPFLVITGELSDGRQLYDKATGAAYWLKIMGSTHMNMGDPLLYLGAAKDKRISQVLHVYTLSALNKFLINKDDHLLDGTSPLYPEVKNLLMK
ncbi:MAG: alpha/beta hydrolase family protein [Verrucomicrobiia bacterium]